MRGIGVFSFGTGVGGLNTASNASGTVTSGGSVPSRWMPEKSCGVTPMIVTIWPLIDTTRLIADGAPANRFTQYGWLMTATGGALSRSSLSPNTRPRAAWTPSTVK